jgi:alkylation response protein AidB-like acyl-CoA dehydrogenase
MLRTKAVRQADGSFKITGTRIFISAGEHDLFLIETRSCRRPLPFRSAALV